ncbi:dehydrase and lipid transport-domain-containing protein, partial [Schizothecium vesticola]
MRSLHPPRATLLALRRPPRHAPLSTFSRQPHPQPRARPHPQPQLNPPKPRPLSFLASLLPNPPSPGSHQTLHAHRLLPYPPSLLHALIADVDSYYLFLPHCTASRVTRWITPPTTTPTPAPPAPPRLPFQADLTVGYGPLTQSYTSLVYSIPSSPGTPGGGGIVEAVSGAATTTIPPSTLHTWGYPSPAPLPPAHTGTGTGIFESLVTRWTVAPAPGRDDGWSEVTLTIRYRFANAALGAAVGQVAGGMVEEMVGAFEGRARGVLGEGMGGLH